MRWGREMRETNGLPTGETVLVTPEMAAEMLLSNTHNRRKKSGHINKYAQDMTTGAWRWTAEPIRFDRNGVLLDGQNRLHAVIESGVSVPFLVVRGLEPEAQEEMDTGSPRTLADVMALRGESDPKGLAALVRKVEAWERGERRNVARSVVSNSTLLRVLDKHPELRDYNAHGRRVASKVHLPSSLAGLAWWVFDGIDAEDGQFFFERLADGAAMVKGDPVFELRRTLHELTRGKHLGTTSFPYLLAITIKAWNAYRLGEKVGLYRWRAGGAKPEPFPEPR